MEKILHINDYPAELGGGAEVVMKRTIDLLRQRGHVADTFTAADLPDPRLTPLRYLDNFQARRALTVKLLSFRPHVVHLHNFYHILSPGILKELAEYKKQYALRVVMTAHDYHLVCPNAGGTAFRWWTGQHRAVEPQRLGSPSYLLSRSWDHRGCLHSLLKLLQHTWNYGWHRRQNVIDCVICPSRFVQRMLEPCRLRTRWLPHPVPPLNRVVSGRKGLLHFVFAGRLEPEKGLREFLHALPDEFDAQLTILGSGSELSRCQKVCAGRGWTDKVQFLGRLSHSQTLEKIAEAHVLVQPSRVLETYGLTLIEALASGTNLLVSDRGALREIVEDAGVGFLFDVEKPDSLTVPLQTVARQFEEGTLNRFQIGSFLESRSETAYVDSLLRLYECDTAAGLPLAA